MHYEVNLGELPEMAEIGQIRKREKTLIYMGVIYVKKQLKVFAAVMLSTPLFLSSDHITSASAE